MQTLPTMICDRCGCSKVYLNVEGANGMISWHADLCSSCFNDVKAMMLNANNRLAKNIPESE